MERLLALIDDVYKYVDDVVVSIFLYLLLFHSELLLYITFFFHSQERRVPADNSIGRFISDTVASLPKLSPPAFDKLVNDSLQVTLSLICFLVSLQLH